MSAHTPGPWEHGRHPLFDGFLVSAPGSNKKQPGIDGVALVTDHPATGEHREADAHLIAASPDLLATLKAVEKAWLDGLISHPEFPIRQVRAAIAKAEGRP